MPDYVEIAFVLYLPALLISGAFYATSRYAVSARAATLLRNNAIAWLIICMAVFPPILIIMETCSGNMVAGYHNCTIVPASLADRSLPAFLLTVGLGGVYSILLALAAGVQEVRARRAEVANPHV